MCALPATVDDLFLETRFDGRLVGLRNAVPMPLTICTDLACLGPDQCCNRCTSTMYLERSSEHAPELGTRLPLADQNGKPYVSRGDECAIDYMLRTVPHLMVGTLGSAGFHVEYMIPEQP